MNWNEKLQIIIDYVENHLQRDEEPIYRDDIAKIAGCSFDFFQKVFSYMNGISFFEYVRGRKLTLAGYDLKSTNMKVVDVAYKYGYDSPTSFTKAFQQFHGITPKQVRNNDIQLRVISKMQITYQNQYSWRIEHKLAFYLIGKTVKISCINNQHYTKIPEFWHECQKDGTYSQLMALDSAHHKGIYGLFGKFDNEKNEIEYAIMVQSNRNMAGWDVIFVPENTWAVFDCRGPVPEAIHKGWIFLNEEWLVKYPFEHAKCPELEWYSDGNIFSHDYLSQIWIPIIEKEK